MSRFSRNVRVAGRVALLAVLYGAGAQPLSAQTGSGTYGASFLKVPAGARLMSSPDIVAGMRPDASLLYSNPAFLSGLENTGLFVSSSRWLDELSFNSIGAGIPLGRGGTVLGIGTTLLYSGGLEGYDESMNVVSDESFYDLGLDLALAHRFGSSGLSAAFGATYIREHLLPEDGSGYAFHVGASYWRGPSLFHVAGRDLGGAVNFPSGSWPIASEWIAGGGRVFNSGVGQFFAGVQAASSDAYGTRVQLGVDYAINGMFTLHTGLNDNLDDTQSDSRVNGGFGMRYGAFSVEYAYTPRDYFSSAHTFSLAYAFGTAGPPDRAGATVPFGDLAPPIPAGVSDAGLPVAPDGEPEYLLVAGAHADLESARYEARALEQLNIPAEVANEGPRFRVVVGRYATFDGAAQARSRYRTRGHDFQILAR